MGDKNVAQLVLQARSKNPDHIFYVFLNGSLASELSDTSAVLEMIDGVSIRAPRNAMLQQPLHLLYLQTQDEQIGSCLQHNIIAEENSQLTVIEEYASHQAKKYCTQALTQIVAYKNAQVHYHKIQQEDFSATHKADIQVKQYRDSQVNYFTLATGSLLARENLRVSLSEEGAACQLHGFYGLSNDAQQIEHHVHVDHEAPLGNSTMLYKGILDKKSRAVFSGKVYVHPKAQKTNAAQENHHLLLSNLAEASSKPELEIYADDIKCKHGATVGQLDEQALFYLRSRGIDKHTATRCLLYSFAEEVFNKVKNVGIANHMISLLKQSIELQ